MNRRVSQKIAEEKYPELWASLRDNLEGLLVAAGVDPQKARDVAAACTESTRKLWGGGNYYFPRGMKYELTFRDHELFRKFTGDNVPDLAREYEMSEQRVYQIIAKVRGEILEKTQMKMF